MVEDNKTLVRHFYERIVNTGNITGIAGYISEEYTVVSGANRYAVGIQGAIEHIAGVRKTYPDLHLTIERQIAEDDWVATCITASGTHKGEWMGIAPTGKQVVFTGVNIDRVVDGKIVEHGGAANTFESLLEIGAIQVVGKQSAG